MIDWLRVAEPQEDGYDVQVIAEGLRTRYGWTKTQMHPDTLHIGSIIITDGGVDTPTMVSALDTITLPQIDAIEGYLKVWPTGWTMMQALVDEFWVKRRPGAGVGSMGYCSRHYLPDTISGRTVVCVTIGDPQGCAEGMYHEVAHIRLWALGIGIASHSGLLFENQDTELYDSPYRNDIQRPMSALIHGLYAWTMLTTNDIHVRTSSMEYPDPYIQRNYDRLKQGLDTVATHVRPTPIGRPFIDGLLTWGERVIAKASGYIA